MWTLGTGHHMELLRWTEWIRNGWYMLLPDVAILSGCNLCKMSVSRLQQCWFKRKFKIKVNFMRNRKHLKHMCSGLTSINPLIWHRNNLPTTKCTFPIQSELWKLEHRNLFYSWYIKSIFIQNFFVNFW